MKRYYRAYSCWGSYRHPKTTQERRANGVRSDEDSHYEYVRGGRKGKNLPNSYDDLAVAAWKERRCWKSNRKNQYRPGGRGTRHELLVPGGADRFRYWWNAEYRLEEYFDQHNIPYHSQYDPYL